MTLDGLSVIVTMVELQESLAINIFCVALDKQLMTSYRNQPK